ncbi:MAG: hypothetical protein ACYS22_05140 [Planctomycetota bacterium]|jgi:hypothetical protein
MNHAAKGQDSAAGTPLSAGPTWSGYVQVHPGRPTTMLYPPVLNLWCPCVRSPGDAL